MIEINPYTLAYMRDRISTLYKNGKSCSEIVNTVFNETKGAVWSDMAKSLEKDGLLSKKVSEALKANVSPQINKFNVHDEIMRAFGREDVDIKTFKSLVKKAVKNGLVSKEYGEEIIERRKLRDAINSPFMTRILDKYCKK